MRRRVWKPLTIAALTGGLAAVFAVTLFAQYTMTVNKTAW